MQRNDRGTGQGLRLRDFEVAGVVFASLLGLLLLLTFQLRSDAHGRAIDAATEDVELMSAVVIEPHATEIASGSPLAADASAALHQAMAPVLVQGRIAGAQIFDRHAVLLWTTSANPAGTNAPRGKNAADALRRNVVSHRENDGQDERFGNVVEVLVPEPGTSNPRWVVESFVPLAPIEAGATRTALVVFGIGFAIVGALTLLILRLRRRAGERELQALVDTLTRLPNRRAFEERLLRDCKSGANGCPTIAVVRVDGVRQTDNVLGAEVGDAAVLEVANRLGRAASQNEMLAKTGMNEFAFLLDPRMDRATVVSRVEALVDELTGKVRVANRDLEISAHGGIVLAQGKP